MQRRLRVCCELPPRHSRGADSSSNADAPASRAIKAAHNAALPPPITNTSTIRVVSFDIHVLRARHKNPIILCRVLWYTNVLQRTRTEYSSIRAGGNMQQARTRAG